MKTYIFDHTIVDGYSVSDMEHKIQIDADTLEAACFKFIQDMGENGEPYTITNIWECEKMVNLWSSM